VLYRYISTLSLTLALLNLLPLPKLDGGHVLTALLDWIYPGTNEPIEDLEDGAGEQFYGFGEHSLSPRRGQLYEGAQEVSTFTATVENKRRRHLIERSISWGCGAIVVSGLGGMVMGMAVEHFGLK
jgi:membrane-associated protease RseP (regulator of RpoE activity)